ncbi:hypothetical protein BJ322DRAFT_1112242 [Thelephora terrestris]|uniref:Uncharacterized protein n=1 Tax=Thelephora terrestris TaxID=56493 RepID=A0A9P6L3Q1_9AGAM|nr:hypothetical protein BJ322DRAFT_1112242 [Thelephora terrestris]
MTNRKGDTTAPNTTPQPPGVQTTTPTSNPARDTDHEMGGMNDVADRNPPTPSHPPSDNAGKAGASLAGFTLRIPGPKSYANALKRPAEQTGSDNGDAGEQSGDEQQTELATEWAKHLPSGPIKGFNLNRVLENLNPLVREAWESKLDEAVFVHYLDGGYNPALAQKVHVITDDLKKLYTDIFRGTDDIEPTVVYPTPASPHIYNAYAAPFIFMITDIPVDFRKWLVTTGIHEVTSNLGLLFFENGRPIPHDYAVTLTNYNMRTDTDVLRDRTHQRVRKSVVDMLFNTPSDTQRRTTAFVGLYRDNLADSLSNEEACAFVSDSIRVTSLDIAMPKSGIHITVYNVYVHPPSADPELLKRWRQWVTGQKYHADINGVGMKYQHPWNCLHCKAIDHPSGLCAQVGPLKMRTAGQQDAPTPGEELLPLDPPPGPPHQPHHPPTGTRDGARPRGRTGATPTRARGAGSQKRSNARRTHYSRN